MCISTHDEVLTQGGAVHLPSQTHAALSLDALYRADREVALRVGDGDDPGSFGVTEMAVAALLPNEAKSGGLELPDDVPALHSPLVRRAGSVHNRARVLFGLTSRRRICLRASLTAS